MAIAHVQSGGATAASFSFGSTVGSGHTVCVAVAPSGAAGAPTVTDDKSNTYTLVTDASSGSNGVWLFFAANITNGPQTITATLAGATFFFVGGDEFSGVSNLQDGHNATVAYPNPPSSTGVWTTTLNGDLIWGGVLITGGFTWARGTGFTTGYAGPASGTDGGGTLYQIQATPSAATAVTVTTSWPGWIAGFALGEIITYALAANDAVETAAFNTDVIDNLTLAANDVVETASFTIINENFIALSANDVVESAAFSAVTIPANTSAYSIIPLTGI